MLISAQPTQVPRTDTGFSIPADGVPLTVETAGDLPDTVSYVPSARPDAPSILTAEAQPQQPEAPVVAAAPAGPDPLTIFPAVPTAPVAAAQADAGPATAEPQTAAAPPPAAPPVEAVATATAEPAPTQVVENIPPPPVEEKRKSFLSAFFGSSKPAAPQPASQSPASPILASYSGATPTARENVEQAEAEDESPRAFGKTSFASLATPPARRASAGGMESLPGVRTTALFEIRRGAGLKDDDDVDVYEQEDEPIRVASAAGLARLAPNGLLKQTDNVDVACLKPALVRMLRTVEGHYGKKAVVTSGYRSPPRNRKARGARNSLHMFCAAADVQVPGVSKWELAQFVRTMPGRGGVGTYCHTESVHIDIGPERDWNWRCRRRR